MSNTATAAMLLPVVSSLTIVMKIHPLILSMPTALAATCSFMLPVATPPNAIVFGSGRLTVGAMARVGLVLNLLLVLLITAATIILVPRIIPGS
jgi:sodium-dependent dicarboxylate transporter 2/3/5